MFVRYATLNLGCEGFDRAPQSTSYSRKLGKAEAKAHVKRIVSEETDSKWKGGVKLRFGVKEAGVEAQAGKGASHKARAETTIEAPLDFPLVQNLPNLAYRIGDAELGDIRKRQGFLEGDYLFQDCPEKTPLCLLEAREGGEVRSITATLSVSLRNGVHVVADGAYASDPPIAGAEREGEFARAFKDRLRSLALHSGISAGDGLAIARHTIAEVVAEGGKR